MARHEVDVKVSKKEAMTSVTDDIAREQAPPPPWPADLADALDMAVAWFDAQWRLVRVNGRWQHRYGTVEGKLETVVAAMLQQSEHLSNTSADPAQLRDAIRLYARDAEIALPDGSSVLLTSSPLAPGGAVVTTRDMQRDRLSEDEMMRLLSEGLASVDMGMLLWDAGLIARLSNRGWAETVLPVATGDPITDLVERLIAMGLNMADACGQGRADVRTIIAEMHRQPRQWVLKHPDGRSTRVFTYPTRSGGVLATSCDNTLSRTVEERAHSLLADAIESMGLGVMLIDEGLRARVLNTRLVEMAFHPDDPPRPDAPVTELMVQACKTGRLDIPEGVDPSELASSTIDTVLKTGQTVALRTKEGGHLEAVTYSMRMGGYVAILRDVTDQVRAKRAVADAHATTRTIVQSLGEGVALFDSDRRLLLLNPAFERIGMKDMPIMKVGDLMEDGLRATVHAGNVVVPTDDEDAAVTHLLELVCGYAVGVEVPMADGRWMEGSTYPTPENGYLMLLRDITERKEAERKARKADQLLRTTIEASPTPILVSRRRDGRIFFASEALHALLGKLDSTVNLFVDADVRKEFLEQLVTERQVDELPAKFRRKDESIVDVMISSRLIDYGGEEVVISSILDMTDVLAMQTELDQQRDAAHQAEKLSALGELLAGVAHELNNPLSIILAHATMLETESEGTSGFDRAKKISAAAERSGRIVRSFLSMARKRPVRMETSDINEIVSAAADISTYGVKSAGTKVQIALTDAVPLIEADAVQIVQVVSNLVVNAGYAVRDLGGDGVICLRTARTPAGDALIEVQDNGAGVPDELKRRVFEPFFTTKSVGSGTGIGLAFCHRVITAHGGELRVADAPGGGAVFSIRLPASSQDLPQVKTREPAQVTGKILVIDDERELCEALVDILQSEGFEACGVYNAQAALNEIRGARFDAVLSDVRMPGMNGLQFLDALQEIEPALARRTGFVTGDAIEVDALSTAPQGALPMISKPVTQSAIVAFVTRLMEQS